MTNEEMLQEAIDALFKILVYHENHLWARDREALERSIERLEALKRMGFDES